jgi:hypothetical protein
MAKKKQRDPAAEERALRNRIRALEKAREARIAKQKAALDEKLWAYIGPMKSRRGCKCKIRKGMTLEQLRPLNGGCTESAKGGPGWVCPVLDAYRRLLEKPGDIP